MIRIVPLDQVEWTKTKQNSQEIKKDRKGTGFQEILDTEMEKLDDRESSNGRSL